ncbi:Homeobox protein HD-5 [Gracilariopsis chorda]|uniref:Homeobox protein HD-5 n=1 Tax=Gracilariopsis chorda TaxID=448386 RepID=A0A2V3J4N2_9FLOR|nr:Homeobox protein HD-5 [Gracilariopsis chorda]|eukprot:PXF48330.1 Homeobox protein HD-5 [Gracilariopsis chorda]
MDVPIVAASVAAAAVASPSLPFDSAAEEPAAHLAAQHAALSPPSTPPASAAPAAPAARALHTHHDHSPPPHHPRLPDLNAASHPQLLLPHPDADHVEPQPAGEPAVPLQQQQQHPEQEQPPVEEQPLEKQPQMPHSQEEHPQEQQPQEHQQHEEQPQPEQSQQQQPVEHQLEHEHPTHHPEHVQPHSISPHSTLQDIAGGLQHDLQAVAQQAVAVKTQPQQSIQQLAEQPSQQPMDYAEPAATEPDHTQQTLIHDADPQNQPAHAAQQIVHTVATVMPQLSHTPDVHGVHKPEPQLETESALATAQSAQIIAASAPYPTASIPIPTSASTAVQDLVINKVPDGDHVRAAAEYSTKPQQQPLHHTAPVHSRRAADRSKRGSERYHASGEQLKTLIAAFEQDPTPSAGTLNYLSASIAMPMHNLVLWFKNRRARHKRTHANQSSRGGKRSYVKSGIYSRNKRTKQSQHHPAPSNMHTGALTLPLSHGLSTLAPATVPASSTGMTQGGETKGITIADAKRDFEDLIKTGAPHPSQMKRPRFVGIAELLGEENPCHSWTAEECHRRCVAFFDRTTNNVFPEQSKLVEEVSSVFFLSELQSGFTLTSTMQPLETTVAVLDGIVDRLPSDGPRLSSGSRVIMREFLAQVRTGNAMHLLLAEATPEAGETVPDGEDTEAAAVPPAEPPATEQQVMGNQSE